MLSADVENRPVLVLAPVLEAARGCRVSKVLGPRVVEVDRGPTGAVRQFGLKRIVLGNLVALVRADALVIGVRTEPLLAGCIIEARVFWIRDARIKIRTFRIHRGGAHGSDRYRIHVDVTLALGGVVADVREFGHELSRELLVDVEAGGNGVRLILVPRVQHGNGAAGHVRRDAKNDGGRTIALGVSWRSRCRRRVINPSRQVGRARSGRSAAVLEQIDVFPGCGSTWSVPADRPERGVGSAQMVVLQVDRVAVYSPAATHDGLAVAVDVDGGADARRVIQEAFGCAGDGSAGIDVVPRNTRVLGVGSCLRAILRWVKDSDSIFVVDERRAKVLETQAVIEGHATGQFPVIGGIEGG